MLTKCIFQSGVGAAINGGFSHRSSCPRGHERSPKSAPQHAPTVITHLGKSIPVQNNARQILILAGF